MAHAPTKLMIVELFTSSIWQVGPTFAYRWRIVGPGTGSVLVMFHAKSREV
jgi:hypothetical protein